MSSPRRVALVIGVAQYTDSRFRELRAPVKDVEGLAAVLGDDKVGQFDVTRLIDPTVQEIREAVDDLFSDATTEDFLLLHMSCHGVKDRTGELYFAGRDTNMDRLHSTGVGSDWLISQMSRSDSRRALVLLDCCFSGSFDRTLLTRSAATNVDLKEHLDAGLNQSGQGRARVIVTASSAIEYAHEGASIVTAPGGAGTSVFTSAVVAGLRSGDADRDQDGQVSLDELYEYVFDHVQNSTTSQHPEKWVYGSRGSFYVAKNAKGVPALPLPEQIRQNLRHESRFIREAGVRELVELANTTDDRRMIVSVRHALEQLADDDSRVVAGSAAAALAGLPDIDLSGVAPPRDDRHRVKAVTPPLDEHEADTPPFVPQPAGEALSTWKARLGPAGAKARRRAYAFLVLGLVLTLGGGFFGTGFTWATAADTGESITNAVLLAVVMWLGFLAGVTLLVLAARSRRRARQLARTKYQATFMRNRSVPLRSALKFDAWLLAVERRRASYQATG